MGRGWLGCCLRVGMAAVGGPVLGEELTAHTQSLGKLALPVSCLCTTCLFQFNAPSAGLCCCPGWPPWPSCCGLLWSVPRTVQHAGKSAEQVRREAHGKVGVPCLHSCVHSSLHLAVAAPFCLAGTHLHSAGLWEHALRRSGGSERLAIAHSLRAGGVMPFLLKLLLFLCSRCFCILAVAGGRALRVGEPC